VVAGILPLAAPATPAGAQLDNAMSARRGGDGGAQVEPGPLGLGHLRATKEGNS